MQHLFMRERASEIKHHRSPDNLYLLQTLRRSGSITFQQGTSNIHLTPKSQSSMASFLITGASRGLGLAFVKELASRKSSDVSNIFAGARSNVPALQELSKTDPRVQFVKLDVTNPESVKEAAAQVEKKLEGRGLDVLINNAAVCHYDMQKMTNPTLEKDIMREM